MANKKKQPEKDELRPEKDIKIKKGQPKFKAVLENIVKDKGLSK